jgi:AcrR family transcriptional regulator
MSPTAGPHPARPSSDQDTRPRRGRPPTLAAADIVLAAVEVGFGRIAMTTVAERLGTRHSTLYRYFATRDDLVIAAMDHVVSAVTWPEPGDDWAGYLREHAWTTFRLLDEHPGLAGQVMSLRAAATAYREVSKRTVTALLDLGFGAAEAILAYDLLHELVLLFFLAGQRPGDTARTPDEAAQLRRDLVRQSRPEGDPRLLEALVQIVNGPPREWFARKLDVLITGLASLAPPNGS